jgi:hypothetical protein
MRLIPVCRAVEEAGRCDRPGPTGPGPSGILAAGTQNRQDQGNSQKTQGKKARIVHQMKMKKTTQSEITHAKCAFPKRFKNPEIQMVCPGG